MACRELCKDELRTIIVDVSVVLAASLVGPVVLSVCERLRRGEGFRAGGALPLLFNT